MARLGVNGEPAVLDLAPDTPLVLALRNLLGLCGVRAGFAYVYLPLRTSSVRSLGAYFNAFVIESFMDELAAAPDRVRVAAHATGATG